MNKRFLLLALSAAPIFTVAQSSCNQELASRVTDAAKEDQTVRAKGMELSKGNVRPTDAAGKMVDATDALALALIRDVLKQCGWPKQSVFGWEVVGDFATLLIHQTAQPILQRQALELMENAVKSGEASGQDFALLTDKILVGESKPQRYGTQLDWSFNVRELEDPSRVDERRAALGMMPLSDYVEMTKKFYANLRPVAP